MELALAFQCFPVNRAWRPSIDGGCVNMDRLYLGNAIPNVLTDLILIFTPLPLILGLSVTTAQRLSLYAVFTIGGV